MKSKKTKTNGERKMNLSSFIGLILGAVFIVWSILMGGDLRRYFDPSSVMIVFGGVLAATMVSYSFEKLKIFLPKLKEAFIHPDIDMAKDIENIIRLANIARRQGLLALDGEDFGDPFLQKGIELVVDGTESELVKEIMESEITNIEETEEISPTILLSMAQFAPAFGMVGTLIGLINMLMFLEDSATIGPSMATALITTFYGVILANLVFIPLSSKLKVCGALRVRRYEILLEGILSIQNGENPRLITEKLHALVPDKSMLKEKTDTKEKGFSNEKEKVTE